MREPNPWCHSFTKALILQSVRTDSLLRAGCLACLKCTCSGTRTVQSIAWAKSTCFTTHVYLHLILQDGIHLGCTRRVARMSLQAQVDWKSRGFALLYCAIANIKQESLQLEQIVAGVSAEVTDCSQLWTRLVLILVWVASVIVSQHSSICVNFHAGLYPH